MARNLWGASAPAIKRRRNSKHDPRVNSGMGPKKRRIRSLERRIDAMLAKKAAA